MRRPLVLLLAPLLAAPLLPQAATAAARTVDHACPPAQIQEDAFRDVPVSNAHEAAVDCVVHWRVAAGKTALTYLPDGHVERGQMASFVARLVERTGGTLPAPSRDWFDDDDGTVHEENVNRLAEAGVVGGRAAGVYAPAEPVTRAELAALLVRAHDLRAAQAGRAPLPDGADAFPDDEGTALEAEVDTAAAAGLVGGFADGTYRPERSVLRDQTASGLSRALDVLVQAGLAAVPPGPRQLTATGWRPYASVGPVVLHAPSELVEVVGYHQSNHDGALGQAHGDASLRSLVLPSRGRGTHPQSAADVVADPSKEVRSPVTGTVARAGSYDLYCRYPDHYLVVRPDARPGWEVKLLHFEGLRVRAGDRVEAGVTVVGSGPRILPFRSQVDDHTAAPHWPHLHVEVVDPSVPDRPSGGC